MKRWIFGTYTDCNLLSWGSGQFKGLFAISLIWLGPTQENDWIRKSQYILLCIITVQSESLTSVSITSNFLSLHRKNSKADVQGGQQLQNIVLTDTFAMMDLFKAQQQQQQQQQHIKKETITKTNKQKHTL